MKNQMQNNSMKMQFINLCLMICSLMFFCCNNTENGMRGLGDSNLRTNDTIIRPSTSRGDSNTKDYHALVDSGSKNGRPYVNISNTYTKLEIDDMTKRALDGDEEAYISLDLFYGKRNEYKNFLEIAMTVSHRYNRAYAYYDVFYALTGGGDKMFYREKSTQELALYYLTKAHQLGNENATNELKKIFPGESKFKSPSYYLNEID